MQAYTLTGPSGPAALHLTALPTPTPGPDEVLLRTTALSLNPVDAQTSHGKGFYSFLQHESPLIPGWDVVGEVTAVGTGVTAFQPGEVVFGMVNFPGHGRAFAEYVAAPAHHLARKPTQVSDAEAVAATLAALTAWQVLAYAQVQPGQRVLIHAAAGGVGHYAVQLAKERGAYVIATASTGKVDFVRTLGADEVVDYTQVQFEEVVAPVDLVLDSIGGAHLGRSLNVVQPGGFLISIAGELPPNLRPAPRPRASRSTSTRWLPAAPTRLLWPGAWPTAVCAPTWTALTLLPSCPRRCARWRRVKPRAKSSSRASRLTFSFPFILFTYRSCSGS